MFLNLYTAIIGLVIGFIADYSLTAAFLFMGGIITTAAILLRIDNKQVAKVQLPAF